MDLAALRVVPVPEGRRGDGRPGGPRAAPEHLVAVAEEDLRVLAIGEGAEARIGAEVARRPLPRVADHPAHAARGGAVRVGAGGGRAEAGLVEVRAVR